VTEPVEPGLETAGPAEQARATFIGPVMPREPTPEEARRNVLFGLALFGVFVLLFGGTVVVALIYLAVVD
jgi:hypothetical protein